MFGQLEDPGQSDDSQVRQRRTTGIRRGDGRHAADVALPDENVNVIRKHRGHIDVILKVLPKGVFRWTAGEANGKFQREPGNAQRLDNEERVHVTDERQRRRHRSVFVTVADAAVLVDVAVCAAAARTGEIRHRLKAK